MTDTKQHLDGMRLSITGMKIIGTWNYDTDNTNCPICRENLQLPSLISKKKNTVVIIGECNHAIHQDCINNNNTNCPICNKKWLHSNTVGGCVYMYPN